MKLKQLALILSAMTFAQATLAAAPLCRSVLRSFTQEQVNAAIEDFTRLILQADNAQVDGDKSVMTRSLLASKQLKEKEILQSLNISREELRKLVSARSAILQKQHATEARSREKAAAREADLRIEFKQEKHFEPNFSGVWQFNLVADGTKLLASGSNKGLMSLEDGTVKSLFGQGDMILPDALFTSDTTQLGKMELTVTNLHNGTQIKHDSFQHPFAKMAASDRQSIVKFKTMFGSPFEYQHVDKNGALLNSGIVPQLEGALLQNVGSRVWLFSLPDKSHVLFNPQTQDITPLVVKGNYVSDLSNNKIGIQEGSILHTVDLVTGNVFSKDLGDNFSIKFWNSKFIWIEKTTPSNNHSELRKLDANTLQEVPGFSIPVGNISVRSKSNSGLIAISSTPKPGSPNHIQSGVYRMDKLEKPVFDVSEIYANERINIKDQLLSEDGETLVVIGTDANLTGDKYFVDVYRLK